MLISKLIYLCGYVWKPDWSWDSVPFPLKNISFVDIVALET